jgi:integrase
MSQNVISYKNREEQLKRLRFVVKSYRYFDKENKSLEKLYVVLIDAKYGLSLKYTRFEDYLLNPRKDKVIFETLRKRAYNICAMLNYLMIDAYSIKELSDVTYENLEDFFNYYSIQVVNDKYKKKETIGRCMTDVCKFFEKYICKFDNIFKFQLNIDELFTEEVRHYKYRGKDITKIVKIPNFIIKEYKSDEITKFRDFPESYLKILIKAAELYDPMLKLFIISQAYAGLREAEGCNMTMASIKIEENLGFIKDITINLLKDAQFGMLTTAKVGHIKKHREQKVYKVFLEEFQDAYLEHLRLLEKVLGKTNLELGSNTTPLFYNNWGKPLTAPTYETRLKKLFYKHFLPMLQQVSLKTVENRIFDMSYIEKYKKEYPGAHCLRHWFTMKLLTSEPGINESVLKKWRGDSNVDSASAYIHLSGELKQVFLNSNLRFQQIIWDEIVNDDVE